MERGDCLEKFFLLLFLSCCSICDLRKGKVPNGLILLGVAAFAISGFIRGPSPGYGVWEVFAGTAFFLIRTVFAAAVFFPLFLFRMMGAGDIKVMAVIAGSMGMDRGIEIIFYGLAAAAAWSLFYMLKKHILVKRIRYFLNYIKNLLQTERLLPYYTAGEPDRAGFCLIPFLWCGFCLWLAVYGGAL